ncbi:MAG: hypothetical protein KAU20_06015 [Nanoarchaeota archaeon]|nr:hypothetical protein [Nanoarchaeota archaeon]
MRKHNIEIGTRFERLTVVSKEGRDKWGNYLYSCKCDCGNIRTITGFSLDSGNTKSCGCLKIDRMTTHDSSFTREYRSYTALKSRCLNPDDEKYSHYGGRGIKVCRRWRKDFLNFYKDMGRRPAGLSIDRIDNNKGYSKRNCRWATPQIQARNRRDNKMIEYGKQTCCLAEWSEKLEINYTTLWARIYCYHWDIDRAFNS